MNLLIVEDDEKNIETFQKDLSKNSKIKIVVARSRNVALQLIESQKFDLAIIDLKIPITEGDFDTHIDHGLAVHSALLTHAPGTPSVIFSGYGTLEVVGKLLERSKTRDIWGTGTSQTMTLFKQKEHFGKCLSYIHETAEQLATLGKIDVSVGTKQVELTYEEKKILRIFARTKGGANVRVEDIGGGLSGAHICRIEIQDENRSASSYALVKLSKIKKLEDENRRYQQYVLPVLKVGSYAPVIEFVKAGAAGDGGLFYALAKEFDWSLKDALEKAASSTPQIVDELRTIEVPWQQGAPAKHMAISEIRGDLVDDDTLKANARRLAFDWEQLDALSVRITQCRQHRDLHCLNVLLKNRKDPLLIDFAEVGLAPASLDPLTLELSLLFHPSCADLRKDWPTPEQAERWDDLDQFCANSPFESYVRACRKWAVDVEVGDNGLFAMAYSYATRQLKYKDTNHDLAVAVARCAHRRLTAN